MGNKIIEVLRALEAQRNLLKKMAQENPNDWMAESFKKGEGFAPNDGICWHCHKQIYGEGGISVEEAGKYLTTGCPHCHHSFVE